MGRMAQIGQMGRMGRMGLMGRMWLVGQMGRMGLGFGGGFLISTLGCVGGAGRRMKNREGRGWDFGVLGRGVILGEVGGPFGEGGAGDEEAEFAFGGVG